MSLADEAVYIGPSPASESYLNANSILEAARKLGVSAIHPGYGFLSEDHKFAEKCEQSGVVFVGPPAAVIRSMGDKSEAKQIMRKAGVPVVPGYDGNNQDLEYLVDQGDNVVGYPLLVKANMGGGGKGMKLATSKDELKVIAAQLSLRLKSLHRMPLHLHKEKPFHRLVMAVCCWSVSLQSRDT